MKKSNQEKKKNPWYPTNRKVFSRGAAERAVRVVARLVNEGREEDDDGPVGEHDLFSALHTCGYRANDRGERQRSSFTEQALWRQRRQRIRSAIIQRNLGLVYSCAARFRSGYVDFDDLRSEGLLALVRAVDWYDPWRGNRFSTYACHAIIRAMIRLSRQSRKHLSSFPLTDDAKTEALAEQESWTDVYVPRLQRVMAGNLCDLTDRESDILGLRFPSDDSPRRTLEEVGSTCGLSKERVRQIQNRALRKLRHVLEVDPALQ